MVSWGRCLLYTEHRGTHGTIKDNMMYDDLYKFVTKDTCTIQKILCEIKNMFLKLICDKIHFVLTVLLHYSCVMVYLPA